MTLLVACGLLREARIVRGIGKIPVAGGGDAQRLENDLEDAIAALGPIDAILSSGLAGALDPTLQAGDVIVATTVPGERQRPLGEVPDTAVSILPPGPGRRRATVLVDLLCHLFPDAHLGTVVGSNAIAATVAQKAALRAQTGALAVDMESHVAARVAARHGLPFAALRTISDGAAEALPPAALLGMKPDGTMALGAVLASLARRPGQLPALLRTGIGAEQAFRALGRCHDVLARARVGELDLLEFALDVG